MTDVKTHPGVRPATLRGFDAEVKAASKDGLSESEARRLKDAFKELTDGDKAAALELVRKSGFESLASRLEDPPTDRRQAWDKIGVEGAQRADKEGVFNKVTGLAQQAVAAVARGTSEEVDTFTRGIQDGMAQWQKDNPGKKMTYEDPQRRNVGELVDFVVRTGEAEFNRAPATGSYPGGAQATANVSTWLSGEAAKGRKVPMKEVVARAISENQGNVTLAMGSLAEVLHRNRKMAANVDGLRGADAMEKDYYRFAGAYIGLQENKGAAGMGLMGAMGNIAANPFGNVVASDMVAAGALIDGDKAKAEKYAAHSLDRFESAPIWAKVEELNMGFLAAVLARKDT